MSARKNIVVEWLLRSFAVGVYVLMLWGIVANWRLDTSRYSLLLLFLTEGFTLALVLFARCATVRDASPLPILATLYGSTFFLLLDYGDTRHLIPESAAAVLQLAGLSWQLYAKFSLGRAFGVLPAARFLVIGGPYRFVRHPIYLSYFVSELGFLLANASVRNALVVTALFLTHVLRILREEALLDGSPLKDEYRDYRSRVRYRLLPRIY